MTDTDNYFLNLIAAEGNRQSKEEATRFIRLDRSSPPKRKLTEGEELKVRLANLFLSYAEIVKPFLEELLIYGRNIQTQLCEQGGIQVSENATSAEIGGILADLIEKGVFQEEVTLLVTPFFMTYDIISFIDKAITSQTPSRALASRLLESLETIDNGEQNPTEECNYFFETKQKSNEDWLSSMRKTGDYQIEFTIEQFTDYENAFNDYYKARRTFLDELSQIMSKPNLRSVLQHVAERYTQMGKSA